MTMPKSPSDLTKVEKEREQQVHNEISQLFQKVDQGIQKHQEKIEKAKKNGARITTHRFSY